MSNEDVKAENGQSEPAPADAGQTPAAAVEAAPPAASPPPEPTLEEKLAKAERERAETQERMLRIAADFENYKKRVRRETDDATARAREQLLRDILPVLDNFERAMIAVGQGGTLESLAQGVKLVEKQLHAALEKSGVKAFEAKGEPFDPARHEAIQQVETTEQAPGTVFAVFARGYLLGDRLLRPAMVSVAKAPSAPQPNPEPDGSGEGDGAGQAS